MPHAGARLAYVLHHIRRESRPFPGRTLLRKHNEVTDMNVFEPLSKQPRLALVATAVAVAARG